MINSAYFYLKEKQDNKVKDSARIETFLDWNKKVSPQYNWDLAWIKHVETVRPLHKIFMLSTPPQIGKSTTYTVHLAAYLLCMNPRIRIMIVSYNTSLTKKFHAQILTILENLGIPLYSKSQECIVHGNRFGSIAFRGFSSGITGFSADVMIIDDPIRNAEDAYSKSYQEKLWSGFATSIYSRLQKNAILYITHTRWHDNDLIGQIESKNIEDNLGLDYCYLNLPAICDQPDDPMGREIDESVCPELYTTEIFRQKILIAQGDGDALYQGRPSPPDGLIFKEADIQTFTDLSIIPKNTYKFLSVDCAFKDEKNSDFVAIGVYEYDLNSQMLFLTNMINKRIDCFGTIEELDPLLSKMNLKGALVEAKANGDAVTSMLKKKYPIFILIEPAGGKISRAHAANPFIKTHRLQVYRFMNNFNPFMNQLKSFPRGQNDDMVDSLTQMINYIEATYKLVDYSKVSRSIGALSNVR